MATWMVVEDEPDIYDVLLAMFEIWGIEGVAFVDGAEAVAWLDDVDEGRVCCDLPELAILDIRLPEISGPEVSARLRRSPILGNIGIALITAYRLSPDDEKAVLEQAQADVLLYKPLPNMSELRAAMAQAVAKRKVKAQLVPALPPPARPTPAPQDTPQPTGVMESAQSVPAQRPSEPPPTRPTPAPQTGSQPPVVTETAQPFPNQRSAEPPVAPATTPKDVPPAPAQRSTEPPPAVPAPVSQPPVNHRGITD